MASITIPESVTSIEYGTFSGCSGLTSITIPDSVTSIGRGAFSGCSGLTSITIPDSITSISYGAFKDCSGLTDVYYQGDLSGWVKIEFDDYTSNPTTHTDNLYINGELLKGDIIIPEGTEKLGDYAFSSCSSITSITIPDSVTSIESSTFYNCSGLTSITIPDSVTSIGSYAFYGCSGLTSITIPDSVISIGSSAFYNCRGLTSITVEQGNAVYHSAGNCIIKTASKTLIAGCKNSVIPDDGSVTSIGSYAFRGCSGLTSITIPDSVTSIGRSAFEDCRGLTSIDYQGTMAQWKAISKGSGWGYGTGDFTITCTDGTLDKEGNQI